MRFASLGSGSEGNGLLVEAGKGARRLRVLVDCGFGLREAERRLARLDCEPASLDGILVTHEHGDHVGGVFRLARAHAIPVYLTHGTLRASPQAVGSEALVRVIDSHRPFELGDLRIEPFPVPHDAREPVQYVLDDGDARLGVLTDIGHPTAHVVQSLSRLTALVLETNHDSALLAGSSYPPTLKRRIAGHYGHLENTDSARILARLDRSRLRCVVAAHLSRQNNTAALARAALAPVLGWDVEEVRVADQDEGLDWVEG
ncbi:MAG: MBL fold metallo-hydrolase [Burkholderiaceae bacterium]